MTASSRRFLLRERTSDQHSAVDTAVGSFDSLDQYRLYLQGLHAFRVPLEAQFGQLVWPAHFQTWRPQTIGASLMRDMQDLNVTIFRPFRAISLGCDLESVMGALYVLEGSSLGARILFQRARALGLDEDRGARHLAEQAGAGDWKTYLGFLETAPALDMDKVIAASQAAFALAESAFKE